MEQIKSKFIDFFQDLLQTTPQSVNIDVLSSLNFVNKQLLEAHCSDLIKEVTREEMQAAVFSIPPDKAPGPDGFNGFFFRKVWHIIGEDEMTAIRSFFLSGKLLKVYNHSSITLVPKVANPMSPKDYRPISCYNFLYKCISKVLANRLKKLLPDLEDHSQSAFISGRCISDNILMAQSLLHNYHRRDTSPRCAIKINIAQAYDTVRWDFLFRLLEALKFPLQFIEWIRKCVSSPKYSINVNGKSAGFFHSNRGLRQGDPISSYLFVLIMDALSMIINKKVEVARDFSYHWKCSLTKTTHLSLDSHPHLFFERSPSP